MVVHECKSCGYRIDLHTLYQLLPKTEEKIHKCRQCGGSRVQISHTDSSSGRVKAWRTDLDKGFPYDDVLQTPDYNATMIARKKLLTGTDSGSKISTK